MEIKKLSASTISMYEQCPYKFKLYILGQLPIVKRSYFEFGTLLHNVLDQYFKMQTYSKMFSPFQEMQDIYKAEVHKYAIEDRGTEGLRLLKKYYDLQLENNICRTRSTEARFAVDMGKFKLTGVIDRMDELEDSFPEIIDYKTGKPEKKDLKKNKQLLIYAFKTFKDRDFNLEKCKISLHYLKKEPISIWIYRDEIKAFQIELDELYNKIVSDIYYAPQKNIYCGNCEANSTCPMFAEKKFINLKPSTKKEIIL